MMVPFSDLPGFTPLFRAYVAGDAALDAFFPHRPWSAGGRAAAVAAVSTTPRPVLAEVLRAQNARWAPPGAAEAAAVEAHIAALGSGDAVAIVTGQQLGLFGGPLYTLYKTLTAVQLARQVTAETGRLAVPVFWLEGEDHDFAEVQQTTLLPGADLVALRYAPATPPVGAVGRHAATEEMAAAVEALAAALPATEFAPALLDAVRAAYAPGVTLEDAFARLLRAWFSDEEQPYGLVLLSADDERLKREAAPLFLREIAEGASAPAVTAAGAALVAAGFHAQVQPRPLNLFYLGDDGSRQALDADGETIRLRGGGQAWSRSALITEAALAPERFSPNVVLRPLLQDTLLPTAAYVAGPAEVAYWAQLQGVYAAHGRTMPLVYPRASATLVEARIQKVLDRYALPLPALAADLDALHRRLALDAGPPVDPAFDTVLAGLRASLEALKPTVEAIDKSLGATTEATRAALEKEVEKLRERVIRAQKRNEEGLRGQLDRAHAALFPHGGLQERTLSPLGFLAKYGPGLMRRLVDELPLDTRHHHVLAL